MGKQYIQNGLLGVLEPQIIQKNNQIESGSSPGLKLEIPQDPANVPDSVKEAEAPENGRFLGNSNINQALDDLKEELTRMDQNIKQLLKTEKTNQKEMLRQQFKIKVETIKSDALGLGKGKLLNLKPHDNKPPQEAQDSEYQSIDQMKSSINALAKANDEISEQVSMIQ